MDGGQLRTIFTGLAHPLFEYTGSFRSVTLFDDLRIILVLRLQAPHPPRLRMGLRPAHTEAGYHFRGAWALQCSRGVGFFRQATNPPLGPGALGCALATASYGVPGIFPPVHIPHCGAIYKFLPSAVQAVGRRK